ncbi:hypothetical protein THAOC_21335, partial [Thalassiosira oceanica]
DTMSTETLLRLHLPLNDKV